MPLSKHYTEALKRIDGVCPDPFPQPTHEAVEAAIKRGEERLRRAADQREKRQRRVRRRCRCSVVVTI